MQPRRPHHKTNPESLWCRRQLNRIGANPKNGTPRRGDPGGPAEGRRSFRTRTLICGLRSAGYIPWGSCPIDLSPVPGSTELETLFPGADEAIDLSRLPASPCGLRRDKSALCRRLFDFRPDSLPFAEISIDEITWPLVPAAVANGIEGRLVEADAGCAAADDRFHRGSLRGDATVEPL